MWDQAGSIAWRWLIGLAALAGLAAVAFVAMPKAPAPRRAPVVVREKIPALPAPQSNRPTAALNPASAPQPAHPAAMPTDASVGMTAGVEPGQDGAAAAPVASRPAGETSVPKAVGSGQKTKAGPNGVATAGHAAPAPPSNHAAGAAPEARATPPAGRVAGDATQRADVPPVSDRVAKTVPTAPKKRTPSAAVVRVAPFTVQVGAFHSKAHADRLLARLRKRGYTPFIFIAAHDRKSDLYTVRFGRYASREEAAAAAADFRKKENMDAVVARSGAL